MLIILKIIGIILLCILGLVILLALCILFVPIRYRADINYKDHFKVKVKVTYLLHLFSLIYSKDGESNIVLKIFGIRTKFFNNEEKKKLKKYEQETEMFEKMSEEINDSQERIVPDFEKFKKIDEQRDEKVEKVVNEENCLQENPRLSIAQTETKDSDDSKQLISETASSEKSETDQNNETDQESETDEENEGWFHKKIHGIFNKLKSIIHKIKKNKFRFFSLCGKIKKAYHKAGDLKDFLSDEKTKEAFSFVKAEFFILLKHIRPRKVKGFLHFGFDDPAYTGQVLGIIYMITKGTNKNVQINPDFENTVLEGDLHIKGRVQGYALLLIAYKLYKNDNLKFVLEKRRTYGRE